MAWAGFVAGPVCWFLQQQLALWLVPASCGGQSWIAPALSALFALVLVAAASLSWRSLRQKSAIGDLAAISR